MILFIQKRKTEMYMCSFIVNFWRIFGEVVVSDKGTRIWRYTSASLDTVTWKTNVHSTYEIKNKHIQKNILGPHCKQSRTFKKGMLI